MLIMLNACFLFPTHHDWSRHYVMINTKDLKHCFLELNLSKADTNNLLRYLLPINVYVCGSQNEYFFFMYRPMCYCGSLNEQYSSCSRSLSERLFKTLVSRLVPRPVPYAPSWQRRLQSPVYCSALVTLAIPSKNRAIHHCSFQTTVMIYMTNVS